MIMKLYESGSPTRHIITANEIVVKNKICELLRKKQHNKYRQFFENLDFNLVSHKDYPDFTAAIDIAAGIVYVSTGLIGTSEYMWDQLDVILRHEMAHSLLKHNIRALENFKSHFKNTEGAEHINASSSIHKLMNIIEDYEISNTRYTEADKKIVRATKIGLKTIRGLVTEDDRDWDKMTLRQMFLELTKEMDAINNAVIQNPRWFKPSKTDPNYLDSISADTKNAALMYKDVMSSSGLKVPLDEFIKTDKFKEDYAKLYQDLFIKLNDAFKNKSSNFDAYVVSTLSEIALTNPLQAYKLKDENGNLVATLYSPEEKFVANQALKALNGNLSKKKTITIHRANKKAKAYIDSWNSTVGKLDNNGYSQQDLDSISAELQKRLTDLANGKN